MTTPSDFTVPLGQCDKCKWLEYVDNNNAEIYDRMESIKCISNAGDK